MGRKMLGLCLAALLLAGLAAPAYAQTDTAPAGGVEGFITRLYGVCLGREPDAAGLKNWTDHLLYDGWDGASVAHGFVFSKEFTARNYCDEHFVETLYNAFFGRKPDEAGMQNWLDHLTGGMWREDVLEGFAVSEEFALLCNSYGITAVTPGKTTGNIVPHNAYGTVPMGPCAICGKKDNVTLFVERLYRECLDREGEADGIATWTDHLWSHRKNGREVVKGFALSDEMTLRGLSDEEFIEMLYRAMFGREYDAPGKAVWMDHMQREDWSREQVVDGFADCQEFTDLCKLYCITRGDAAPASDAGTDTPPDSAGGTGTAPEPAGGVHTYILNANSLKFHHENCPSVKRMNPGNRQPFTGTREQVIAMGYTPCSNCNP